RRRASEIRQLGARADRGARAADADGAVDERRDRVGVAVDLAVLEDPHRASADLATRDEVVDVSAQTANSLSRRRSRTSAAVRGRAMSAAPDSPAHPMPASPAPPTAASAGGRGENARGAAPVESGSGADLCT